MIQATAILWIVDTQQLLVCTMHYIKVGLRIPKNIRLINLEKGVAWHSQDTNVEILTVALLTSENHV